MGEEGRLSGVGVGGNPRADIWKERKSFQVCMDQVGRKSLRKACGIMPYLRHWAVLPKERGTDVLFLLVYYQGNQKSLV